jgi:catechol 2,3-dioxygenase-like lactoylglutathione lyase family enzyme
MPDLNYLLLAVKDPRRSAEIYDQLFGLEPVENSPTFVLYVLPTGFKVGLWAAEAMKPVPRPAGGVELSFSLPDETAVRETYAAWTKLGLQVVQEPTRMDFGFTFVVADPDGHRLRPFVLAAEPR